LLKKGGNSWEKGGVMVEGVRTRVVAQKPKRALQKEDKNLGGSASRNRGEGRFVQQCRWKNDQ